VRLEIILESARCASNCLPAIRSGVHERYARRAHAGSKRRSEKLPHRFVWIVGDFHEKAGPCQAVFLGRAIRIADCRPTGGTVSLQSFLHRKVFRPAIDTADRRPAGGAQCCHPKFSNRRLALLPSALFVEFFLRCQLGVLNLEWVLPSRTRTDTLQEKSFLADAAVTRTRRFWF